MGSYRDQYEKYYKNIGGNNSKYVPISNNGGNSNFHYGEGRRKKKEGGMLSILATQTIGILIITLIMMALKYAPYKEANDIYLNAKEVMATEMEFGDFDAVEVFNEFKSKISKDEGIENKINGSLMAPLIGEVETLENGVIIKTEKKKEVFAIFDGEIKDMKDSDKGKAVVIDHGNGIESYYNMISDPLVKKGDKVEKGECIGVNTKIDEKGYKVEFKISYMGQFKEPGKYINFKD